MPVVGAYLSTDDQPQCLGAMRYGVIHRQVQFLPLHSISRGLEMKYVDNERFTLFHGDNRAILPTLPENSVDAIVTDPPYEL